MVEIVKLRISLSKVDRFTLYKDHNDQRPIYYPWRPHVTAASWPCTYVLFLFCSTCCCRRFFL